MSKLHAVIINIYDVVEISVTTIEAYLVQLALDSYNVSDGHLACQAIVIGKAHCNGKDIMLIALSSMETLNVVKVTATNTLADIKSTACRLFLFIAVLWRNLSSYTSE